MVTLQDDQLKFRFSQDFKSESCSIHFQRTLRIPDDNREYPLPPGLGKFPLLHVDDYQAKLPPHWISRGGVFFPMYQAEAMWLSFSSSYPCAIKIAAGKINAITGQPWKNELSDSPQDYVVVPTQRWVDGFCVSKGLIRQFVAMPLGEGFTAEEQITGHTEHGGLQICVYPMKRDFYERWQASLKGGRADSEIMFCIGENAGMGLAPGGLMRQEIFEDPHGLDAWDQTEMSRCYVHIVNSEQYLDITTVAPPHPPMTARDYTNAGFPWFEYYNSDQKALKGAKTLAELDSVATKTIKLMKKALGCNEPVKPQQIVSLSPKEKVKDGQW